MDKFTSRRRATWQSKAPLWPFLLVALAVAVGGGVLVSLYASGVLLGDGAAVGRAVVVVKTLSNIAIPALLIGAGLGALLNGAFLSPAGRDGALKWSVWLMAAAALGAAPMSVIKGVEAARLGYDIRIREAVTDARIASRKSETDFYRRMHVLARHQGFSLESLRAPDGLAEGRKAVAAHRDLVAAARRDYTAGQAMARESLSDAVGRGARREAVLARFDEAQVRRTLLMDRIWGVHERLVALNEAEIELLHANRASWRPTAYGVNTGDRALRTRLTRIHADRRAAAAEHDQLYGEIVSLDAATNAAINRILRPALQR